jgi:predicted nuclease of predicted toxin-antitoxin system
MRFLVDAQLPRRIALWLCAQGHDAIHTLDLPEQNRTADAVITSLGDREGRVVITKDADFVESFILRHEPRKLLLVSTGNISNAELQPLLAANLSSLVTNLETSDFVEISRSGVIVHA